MADRVVWAGRYAVFDEIASGGMASVYLACRLDPGDMPRVVAIKKMFESFAKRPEFVTMFLDEAHIAARIRHPNVVTTYEFLRIPDSLGIVMEFVLGTSLVDLWRIGADKGHIAPLGVTVAIVGDMLAGLHAAHEAKDDHGNLVGLVHRDVSPHNVIVGKDGVARVIDFGIAKAAGRLQVTEVGVMKGKYAYMAPEQIRAGAVDRRVDVYSAGIVLWEAVTGRPLFDATTDPGLLGRRAMGAATAPPASSVAVAVGTSLDAVIEKALKVDPEERFATADEMRTALRAAAKPANPGEVSEWVHLLAGSRLRELEGKRNEVETAYAAGELAGIASARGLDRPAAASRPAASVPSAPAPVAAPDLDIPELAPRPPAPKAPPPRPAAKAPTPSTRQVSTGDDGQFDDPFADTEAQVSLDVAVRSAPRKAALSSSSLDARHSAVSTRAYEGPVHAKRRGGAGVMLLFLALLGGAAAAYMLGPQYLKSAVVAAAARRGLVLSVESIEPRSGGIVLSGVALQLTGVKDVSVKAPEVSVDLDLSGTARKIVVPGYELVVRGSPAEIAARYAEWRASPHASLAFDAKAGHLSWSELFVPGVQVEGINVSIATGAVDDAALAIEAPSFTLSLPRASLGPWRAHLDSAPGETRLTVSLDRGKPEGPPSFVVLSRPALGTVVTAVIPRAKAVQIGIPADFFFSGSDPELDLAFEAQAMPTGEPINARVSLQLFGITGATGPGQPIDLFLEGNIQGDSGKPLPIEPGSLTTGKVKTRITGTVALSPDRVRIEVERPAGRAALAAPFVVDTRDWTAPKDVAPPKPAASASAAPTASAPLPRPHR